MKISVVIGNPNPGGRTTRVAVEVAERVAALVGGAEVRTIELADVASRLFEWEVPELSELTAEVAASECVIAACPTYKASYTGLLKAFFDRYGQNGLAGVVAVPVMMGAAPVHALAVETHLRPLLVELAASVPTRGLYVLEQQVESLGDVLDSWFADNGTALARALGG